ncbi:hypothetical protein DL93DRAFT_2084497 [Clavulina sp. PMI_390]|nr:hypothetical protein DL93DRAFT_2084497 [Clavulina sp. PMI_390]
MESESLLEWEGPTPVSMTIYRLIITVQLVALGIVKAVVSYEDHVVLSTTFDLVMCVLGIVTLYWLGPREALRPKVMLWMFHRDAREVLHDWVWSRQPTISEDTEATPLDQPRLAITMHRLFGSLLILAFGIPKAILGYKGKALAGNTLDWIMGVFLSLVLYWVGLFEWSRPAVLSWFFHRDILSGVERVQRLDPGEYVGYHESWSYETQRVTVYITGYRILTTIVILGFGVTKATLSYMGWTVVPITLEWLMGVVAALILYWMGLYEAPRTRVFPAFFHQDYSSKINSNSVGITIIAIYSTLLLGTYLALTTSSLITKLPTDNAVDNFCRIATYLWFGMVAAAVLLLIRAYITTRKLPAGMDVGSAVGFLIFAYMMAIMFLFFIKQSWGYKKPKTLLPNNHS